MNNKLKDSLIYISIEIINRDNIKKTAFQKACLKFFFISHPKYDGEYLFEHKNLPKYWSLERFRIKNGRIKLLFLIEDDNHVPTKEEIEYVRNKIAKLLFELKKKQSKAIKNKNGTI